MAVFEKWKFVNFIFLRITSDVKSAKVYTRIIPPPWAEKILLNKSFIYSCKINIFEIKYL